MQKNDPNQFNENFSDDPIENLHLENEILKLKLQAQFGAVSGGNSAELPPEVENEFLQNVQRFEEAWQNVKYVKVYDLLGRPDFEKADNISPDEAEVSVARIKKLMAEKEIFLDVLGNYAPSIIYRFITEELFEYETEDMHLPGFAKTFIYEEFHPNHKMDIEGIAQDFLKDWFNKNFDDNSLEFNHEMITANGKRFTLVEMISKLNKALASFVSFSNVNYKMLDTSFEWNVAENRGMGYAEGVVEYKAEIERGERIYIDGSFKFYFCNENGYWNIFYFIFPGFVW